MNRKWRNRARLTGSFPRLSVASSGERFRFNAVSITTGEARRRDPLVTMGDKSPKNIHKQAEKRHEKVVVKEHHKHENAEVQHHPVSGHPQTPEEAEQPKADEAEAGAQPPVKA